MSADFESHPVVIKRLSKSASPSTLMTNLPLRVRAPMAALAVRGLGGSDDRSSIIAVKLHIFELAAGLRVGHPEDRLDHAPKFGLNMLGENTEHPEPPA